MARDADISLLTRQCGAGDMADGQAQRVLTGSLANDGAQMEPWNRQATDQTVIREDGPPGWRGIPTRSPPPRRFDPSFRSSIRRRLRMHRGSRGRTPSSPSLAKLQESPMTLPRRRGQPRPPAKAGSQATAGSYFFFGLSTSS